jgi:hypothetical protein
MVDSGHREGDSDPVGALRGLCQHLMAILDGDDWRDPKKVRLLLQDLRHRMQNTIQAIDGWLEEQEQAG